MIAKQRHICFFAPYYPIVTGGAEYQSRILADGLKAHGYKVTFISYGNFLRDEVIYRDDYKIVNLNVKPTLSNRVTAYYTFMKKVGRVIKDEKVDLIYQRVLNTFSYRLAGIARSLEIPYVLHIADNYSINFLGFKGRVRAWFFKKLLSSYPYFLVQSSFQFQVLKPYVSRIQKIPNLHPIPRKLPVKDKTNTIIWIGNVRPVKRLDLFASIAEQMTDENLKFLVIGRLPQSDLGTDMLRRMEEIENLSYLGEMENHEVNNYLGASKVLVNTSDSEGFSNTFIQAWLHGTLVASLNSNPDSVFENSNLGIYCNGDFEKLIEAISVLVNDRNYHTRSGHARAYANRTFGEANNIQKFISVVEESFL